MLRPSVASGERHLVGGAAFGAEGDFPPICNPQPVVKPVKVVRREIKVSIIGEERMFKPKDHKWDVQAVIDYWYEAMDREIGNKPVTCDTDFGRLGFVTCFDLNFTHFADEYLPLAPDVMVFCSYYDGNFMRNYWAGRIQAYLVGCTVGGALPKTVVGPSGENLLYFPEGALGHRKTVTTTINTNFREVHFRALKLAREFTGKSGSVIGTWNDEGESGW